MNTVVKILFFIVAFFIFFLIVTVLKGGDTSQSGLGGPIGVIFFFVFIAIVKDIWNFKFKK